MIEENTENSKLLSLINEWKEANGSGKTYENVILELLNSDSTLFVQTLDEINETATFISDDNTKVKLKIYTINGKKYVGAFTDLDLLSKWVKVPTNYTKFPSKILLKMVEENGFDGIVINTNYENMFVAFLNK
jgi:benzoyl-CoA reductase/2-hydroxyglutaryl-CoA dehydratase subunit BcrC/BadD/HgdB